MMGVATVRSGDDRFTTMTDPLVKQADVYSDVIVPGPGGCLGAGGTVYEAGKPVMTASIPCQSPTVGYRKIPHSAPARHPKTPQ
jgi:hypothetical protein